MTPRDVLAHQMDLLGRMDDVRFRSSVASAYAMDQGYEVARTDAQRKTMRDNAEVLTDVLRSQVKTAYAYRVTEDMTAMVAAAAEGLDGLDQWDRNLAPTGAGIVRFDSPLLIEDVRGKTLKAHWVIWGPAPTEQGTGMTLTYFNDARDPDDVRDIDRLAEYAEMVEASGTWRWIGSDLQMDGARLGPAMSMPEGPVLEHVIAAGDTPSPSTAPHRFMHALFLLLNQTITDVADEPVERQTLRRAKRMSLPAQVTVIRLRRKAYERRGEGEAPVEWQHQWYVRGYWAWRQCGPDKPGAVEHEGGHRRRVFVAGHFKGPDDKPLVITDKVYELSR